MITRPKTARPETIQKAIDRTASKLSGGLAPIERSLLGHAYRNRNHGEEMPSIAAALQDYMDQEFRRLQTMRSLLRKSTQ